VFSAFATGAVSPRISREASAALNNLDPIISIQLTLT
jgi:hypothetical protein